MTTNFDTRVVIWGMDRSLSLEDFPTILSMDYDRDIEYLTGRSDISDEDKKLRNAWRPKNGTSFNIETIKIESTDFRYISVIGRYELPISSSKAIIDGNLLPRSYRVFNKTVNAVFFELHERVYCALEVSSSQAGGVKSILFGQGYKHKKEAWGKVEVENLPQFSLDSRFFYWIFSQRGQILSADLGAENFTVNVLDVSAVSQLSEREVHDNKNEGPDVLGSISTLSGLGINQSVYEGGFHLLLSDAQLYFKLSKNCTCMLDSAKSIRTGTTPVVSVTEDFPRLAIMMYTLLIPGLLATFHRETQSGGTWSITEEVKQRKNWALQVIDQLAFDNNVSLEDLERIFEKREENISLE